jgi:stage V sporulation protein G
MDERTAAMPPNMELEVKIYPQQQSGGNVLANASVTINGCFAVKGIRVMNGSRGPFVSMPSFRTGNGYKDVCFPCTREFKQAFDSVVLEAYQQEMSLRQEQSNTGQSFGQQMM